MTLERSSVEQSTMRKVYWRLLPLTILSYFLCYLDRINVGFAALTMNKELGLDAATYGMAAGAFFWGYFLFEVPSNIILEKIGARIWIARIMVTWGLLSGATAFCVGPWSFLTMRFLLGLAEAGLFPGIILFFTYWFPDWHRARIVSGFMVALPLAVAAGAPISTALLELNGVLGVAGWKWMFIFEAVPTVLVGFFLLFCITDRPHLARWLSEEERGWLTSTLETERRLVEAKRKVTLWESFWNPKVLFLTLNYFGIVAASIGMLLFLPQIVKQLGLTNMQVGWVTMIPYLCGAMAMLVWGRISDRMAERRWNLFWACTVAAAGLIIAAQTVGTAWALVGMSIAAMGFYGSKGPFWTMPSMILTGTAAASGIAWINSVGNLGGFFGPTVVGWAKDYSGSFAGGLYALAGFALLSAIVSALWLRIPNPAAQERLAGVSAE
ncbi:MAG TPA: MFS transporter [Xanthobacteraceae bacterium]|nr:MFS transporter [Xanthobacteraceae bacterium]